MKEKYLRQQSICFFFFRAFYCPVMANTYSLEVIAALLRYGEPSIWLCCMHSLLAIVVFARWPCLTIKSKCIICLGIHNWRMNISDFFTFYNNVYWNYIEYVYIYIFFLDFYWEVYQLVQLLYSTWISTDGITNFSNVTRQTSSFQQDMLHWNNYQNLVWITNEL